MKTNQTITLLYKAPVGIEFAVLRAIKRLIRDLRDLIISFLRGSFQKQSKEKLFSGGGPTTRRNNLVKGLKQARVPFLFQPVEKLVTKKVGVLSNIEALKWAIKAKQSGKIDYLVAGPNLVDLPAIDYNGIICSEEIDKIVTASRWVTDYWVKMVPELKEKIVEWPTGVDTEYWKPPKDNMQHHILIYDKRGTYDRKIRQPLVEEQLIFMKLIGLLEEKGETILHIAYGTYSPATYREKLEQCKGAIFLSRSETQGSAMFEAWAMNVPTLIWDPGRVLYKGISIQTSACPYLEKRTGTKFRSLDDLDIQLENFLKNLHTYSPRELIIEKYNLRDTAINYLNLFKRI